MRKIAPYKSYKYALASLDNGGRFYNLMSKVNDGNITSAELAKAAGVFMGKQTMMLYLEMSLFDLDTDKKDRVISHLTTDLKSEYKKYKPASFSASEAKNQAVISSTAIVTGIPKLVDSKTEFKGFIMVPIMTGKTTTFTMIPIIDQYDVYELRDNKTDEHFFIAHNRGRWKLPEQSVRCGGVVKELKAKKEEESASDKFLEIIYYSY
ncbi:MAG: hypothetical protein AAFN93_07085 [Bacteroidota bacterium]